MLLICLKCQKGFVAFECCSCPFDFEILFYKVDPTLNMCEEHFRFYQVKPTDSPMVDHW